MLFCEFTVKNFTTTQKLKRQKFDNDYARFSLNENIKERVLKKNRDASVGFSDRNVEKTNKPEALPVTFTINYYYAKGLFIMYIVIL